MKLHYKICTIFYCAGIFWLSSQPKLPIQAPDVEGIDKIAHAIAFGGLAALVSLGIRRSGKTVKPWNQLLIPILFTVAYGLFDEIHQIYVPQRVFDIFDLLADALGALIAQYVLCFCIWKLRMNNAETVTID